jgi:uncharacterized membrane protein
MSINPKTTAAIGDHPLHPMIIPFPVAFLVGAPLADLAFIGTGDGFWARASMWLIGAGIVMALAAAVAGLTDFFSESRIRRLNDAWYHMVGNLGAVVLALVNLYLRYAQGAEAAIKPWGVVLSLAIVAILLFTGPSACRTTVSRPEPGSRDCASGHTPRRPYHRAAPARHSLPSAPSRSPGYSPFGSPSAARVPAAMRSRQNPEADRVRHADAR